MPEDREPAWLQDYEYTNFGDIAVDITAMEEFAKKLEAEVQDNYASHLPSVVDGMLTQLPAPSTTFPELCTFMQTHQAAQDATQSNVFEFANGTNHFAVAAQNISAEYRGSDVFAQARVADVERALAGITPHDRKTEHRAGDL
jgi:hypothetical protein